MFCDKRTTNHTIPITMEIDVVFATGNISYLTVVGQISISYVLYNLTLRIQNAYSVLLHQNKLIRILH